MKPIWNSPRCTTSECIVLMFSVSRTAIVLVELRKVDGAWQFFLLFVLRHSKQVSQYVRLLGHSECMDIDSGFFHALFGSLMLIY